MAKHEKSGSSGAGPERSQRRAGKAQPSAETTAEQIREARESAEAREAESSIRDRMVDIGRANKQAGRQTKS